MKKYFLALLFSSLFLNINYLYSQDTTSGFPYITIPGNNSNIVGLYSPEPYSSISSYICWVNKLDTSYTLYLRRTAPDSKTNVIIVSDTVQIKNPQLTYFNDYEGVRIVWQSFVNNHWQILSCSYDKDTLSNTLALTDSAVNNISPTISTNYIFWIRDSNLVYKPFISLNDPPFIIDSAGCSNPCAVEVNNAHIVVFYEKKENGENQIYQATYPFNYNQNNGWGFQEISKGGNNVNPNVSFTVYKTAYQTLNNGVWKIVYNLYWTDTTDNITYNCENPVVYDYYAFTKKTDLVSEPFVAYDSDSLKSGKEIFIQLIGYENSLKNISNSPGDDYSPHITYYQPNDTLYIAVVWTHEQNNKQDIWMANWKFNPGNGIADPSSNNINDFILNQNFPNPFNPSTEISWNITKGSPVTLEIYDILGNEIATLVNEYQLPGEHSITLDTRQISSGKLSSGVYFYQLKAGSYTLTKKMMYLK